MTDKQRLDYNYLCDLLYTSASKGLLIINKHDADCIHTPYGEDRTVIAKDVEKSLPYIFKNRLCTITHYDDCDLRHSPDFYHIQLDSSLGFDYAASGIPAYTTEPDCVVDSLALYGDDNYLHLCGYNSSAISGKSNLKNPVVLQK
jgi:hypothetical protein